MGVDIILASDILLDQMVLVLVVEDDVDLLGAWATDVRAEHDLVRRRTAKLCLIEVTLEELDKNLRQTTKMASDNEQKLDELNRKLGVQEEELRRAIDRAELAEKNLKGIEEELQMVGENMKQLELSAEKAVEREEKLKEKILSIQNKYKVAEGRFEYGEMNITKLNQRIDDIEDEIYREKLKIKKVADELGDTFDDMLAHY